MTTASTTLLGLALPVTGELSGTWGDVVNASLTNLLDTAIAGTTTLSSDADVTLSTTTLSANQARQAVILWTAGGTATRTITAPAQSKSYVIINATSSSQSIKLVGVGPTTGITIVAGEKCFAAWNGSDFVKVGNTSGAGVFSTVTASSLTSGRVTYAGTAGLLQDSANLTFDGTSLTQYSANVSGYSSKTYSGNNGATTTAYNTGELIQNPAYTVTGVTALDKYYGAVFAPQAANNKSGGTGAIALYGALFAPEATSSAASATSGVQLIGIRVEANRTNANDLSLGYVRGVDLSFGQQSTFPTANNGVAVNGVFIQGSIASGQVSNRFTGIDMTLSATVSTGATAINTFAPYYNSSCSIGGGSSTVAVTNYYGMYIGPLTVGANGSVTNKYQIYQADTAGTNVFSAYSTFANSLAVTGTLSATGVATFGSGNAAMKVTSDGPNTFQLINNALTPDGTNFALEQNYLGTTYLNAATGKNLYGMVGGAVVTNVTSTGLAVTGTLSASGTTNIGGSSRTTDKFTVKNTTTNEWAASIVSSGANASESLGLLIIAGTDNTDYALRINSQAASPLMYVSGGGNLSLGDAPSAWYTTGGTRALQIATRASLFSYSGTTTDLGNNVYQSAAGTYTYIATAASTFYRQQTGEHIWYNAASGTAGNAITFTQAMTLDASGNLGIGTTSPFTRLESAAARATTLNSIASFNTMAASVTDTTAFAVGVGGGINFRAQLTASTYSTYASIWSFRENAATNDYRGSLIFGTSDNGDGYPEERARIDSSGNLLVGTTSQPVGTSRAVFSTTGNTQAAIFINDTFNYSSTINWNKATANNNYFVEFATEGTYTARGSITYNRAGGLTVYSTTSDYRLKEHIIDLPNALETVSRLKPRQFDWKETGNTTTGFIAHELAEVCPHAVTGEKDATAVQTYEISPAVPATFDEEGNEVTAAVEAVMGEREVPRYQGIDTSFLVATLTAAIQEQQAIITALTTRITALENK